MHVPHVYLKGTFMSVNKLPLEIYSTDNWQYLGKFLSQGRGPDEFLSVQFSQDYFFKDDNLVLWISDGALQKRALLNITQSLRIGRTVCDTIFRITSDCSYFQVNDSMVLLQKYVPGNICLSVQNQHTGQTIQEYEFLKSYIPKSIPMPLQVFSEYIYALYVNKKDDLFSHAEGETEIHVFNWKGAPIARIRIPDNIIYFTVDEKHHYIYGLKGNEELYRYKFEI